jgi:regulator of nucleoside diphosphate kinase
VATRWPGRPASRCDDARRNCCGHAENSGTFGPLEVRNVVTMAEGMLMIMSERDAGRLGPLIENAALAGSAPALVLRQKLALAELRDASGIPGHVVTMNSTVVLTDESSGIQRTVRLVYPDTSDLWSSYVSVLSPAGAALLGACTTQTIEFPHGLEGTVRMRVERINYQPEAAGLPE